MHGDFNSRWKLLRTRLQNVFYIVVDLSSFIHDEMLSNLLIWLLIWAIHTTIILMRMNLNIQTQYRNTKLYLPGIIRFTIFTSKQKNIARLFLYHSTEKFNAMFLLHCADFIDFNPTFSDRFGYFIYIYFKYRISDQRVNKSMKRN